MTQEVQDMKASWSGYFRVGELTVPMLLYSGTQSTSPRFVQLHDKDKSPITRVSKCKKDGEELQADDIIRAIERNGKYVELKESDVRTDSSQDKSIIVRQFSDDGVVDSVYYEKPFYMVPGKGGETAYTLLRQAFVQTKKVAITTFTFYEKEHIGIVSAMDGVLMLQQLRFADEIIPRSDINTPPLPQPSPDQVDAAVKLMERYSAPFYIEDYRNEQLDELNEIIERRAKGLPLKRKPQISPHATPEDELVPKLRALLTHASNELR
jgi:DNA end-binding protein Ku